MKITPLAPQFIVESPTPSDEPTAQGEGSHNLKVVASQPSSQGQNNKQGGLNQETREGLRRLSRLLQAKKEHRLKAIEAYVRRAEGWDREKFRGLNLKRVA